jgi:hypothetical protein
MVLPVLIVVVLPHGGKSFIHRSVSSVDPFVICNLVLLITWVNQTFKNWEMLQFRVVLFHMTAPLVLTYLVKCSIYVVCSITFFIFR